MLSGCPRQSVVVNVVSVLLVLLEVRRPLPQNQGYYSDQVSEVSEGQGRTGQVRSRGHCHRIRGTTQIRSVRSAKVRAGQVRPRDHDLRIEDSALIRPAQVRRGQDRTD